MSDDYGTFPKKWAKILENFAEDDFKSNAEASSAEELNTIIVECAKTITNTEKDRGIDDDLKNLKEQLKHASAVYSDVIKAHEAKKRYCVYLLESFGAPVESDDEE